MPNKTMIEVESVQGDYFFSIRHEKNITKNLLKSWNVLSKKHYEGPFKIVESFW